MRWVRTPNYIRSHHNARAHNNPSSGLPANQRRPAGRYGSPHSRPHIHARTGAHASAYTNINANPNAHASTYTYTDTNARDHRSAHDH